MQNKEKPSLSSFVIFLTIVFFASFVSCKEEKDALKMKHRPSEAKLTKSQALPKDKAYQDYLDFFEEIFNLMDENYYQDVSREALDSFIDQFNTKIYKKLKGENKSIDFIKWRSAAFLVDNLKSKEDIFSAFYPPKPAKEYEETALGVRKDLGIEIKESEGQYIATQVEPRSDAYHKGMRINDVLLEIDDIKVASLKESEIKELLNPLIDSEVKIKYLNSRQNVEQDIVVISKEYFKQTVFFVPVEAKGVYCLEIRRFNRKTSEDLLRFLEMIKNQGEIKGLILDLRGNPGGPPLAAREISSFFLPGGDDFAYFQKKNHPKAELDVPNLPEKYHYDGPLVILINKKSGSSSELFSGILQRKGRAVLMGGRSAGQVMLKSMFHLDDESMLLMITSRGHHADGSVFSFDGLMPDKFFEEPNKDDLIDYVVAYFYYIDKS